MFTINYAFQKGGPIYKCEYPDSKIINNNIFIIKGKNDHGKSTIMQMIALGLFGHTSQDINEILKRRIERLLSEETELCEFDYTISDAKSSLIINSNLKNKHITVKINNKPKPKTYVEENFKILFDIPEEPIRKLSSALRSIEHNLRQYEMISNNYLNGIQKCIDELDDFSDKEARLTAEKEKLAEKEKALSNIKDRLSEVSKNYDQLEKANIVVSYEKLGTDLTIMNTEDKELTKRINRLKSAGAGGGNSTYYNTLKSFNEALSSLKFSLNTSAQLSSIVNDGDKDQIKKYTKEINEIITPKDLDEKKLKLWYKYFEELIGKIESNELFNKKLPEESEIALVNRLIPVLKDFIDITTIIPGTNGKTVNQFISELEESRKKLETKLANKLALNNARDACSDIIKGLGNTAIIYSQIPKKDRVLDDDLNDLNSQKEQLQKEIQKKFIEIKKIEEEHDRIPKEERNRLLMMREQVENNYNSTKKEINSLQEKINDTSNEIRAKTDLISQLSKISKPKKVIDREKLKKAHSNTRSVLAKISSWLEFIGSINLEQLSIKHVDNQEAQAFYMVLGDYFADVLGVIYFENKSWKLKKIDFVNKCYVVEGRRPIGFVDMGTGHTALNALLARIKQDYDGKKKILLIDEIGDMDKENISRLLQEIKQQVKDGKILLALLTRSDDTTDKVLLESVDLN